LSGTSYATGTYNDRLAEVRDAGLLRRRYGCSPCHGGAHSAVSHVGLPRPGREIRAVRIDGGRVLDFAVQENDKPARPLVHAVRAVAAADALLSPVD
jgi:hypothetical protein